MPESFGFDAQLVCATPVPHNRIHEMASSRDRDTQGRPLLVSRLFIGAALLVGTVARVLPLFDLQGRAMRQFASEDGYLMLTIARNLAMGNGLSVEDGNTLTNGTQPLMTFVYAGLMWLVDGDKVWGVVLAQLLGIAIGLACFVLLYRVGSRLLAGHSNGSAISAVAAAAWYVSPISTRYTQNCLETGAATLLPLVIGAFFLRHNPGPEQPWSLRRCAGLGALVGVAFWVRNDAVLLAVALCLVVVVSGSRTGSVMLGRRVAEGAVVGTIALLVVSPWLAFNHVLFGHIVPVSGISQGAEATLGDNLLLLPSILAEQISVVAMIPESLETRTIVVLSCCVFLVAWVAGVYWRTRESGSVQKQWLTVLAVWSTLMIGFYGVVYGAGYFMGRYLFPLSPWMALFSVTLLIGLFERVGNPLRRVALPVAFGLVLLVAIGLDVRAHRRGTNNGHFQVVEWVEEHVPNDVWVGAIQTGTLGYFHDRTYNLDGKVSPAALQARLEDGIFDYLLARPTAYLVDWTGIASWLDDERLAPHFELLLLDEEANLAVLRRVTPLEQAPSD
jgi:hypothetical protein